MSEPSDDPPPVVAAGGVAAAQKHYAAAQRDHTDQSAKELARLKERVARSAARLSAVDKETKRKDWTASYRAWDEWEDPEEMEELERAQRTQVEAARKRSSYGGCSHDHSAERAVCV